MTKRKDEIKSSEGRRRRGRPAAIDRDGLIQVALKRGPDRLNLRDIAEELDVPRSTIYNHVRNPVELGRLVLSTLLEPISWKAPHGGWRQRLEFFARQERASLLVAGKWLRFFDDAQIRLESTNHAEGVVAALVSGGFSVEEVGRILALVHGVVLESIRFIQDELHVDAVSHHQLDPNSWPLLAKATRAVDKAWAEDQFEYSLSRVIAGIDVLGTFEENGDTVPYPESMGKPTGATVEG